MQIDITSLKGNPAISTDLKNIHHLELIISALYVSPKQRIPNNRIVK